MGTSAMYPSSSSRCGDVVFPLSVVEYHDRFNLYRVSPKSKKKWDGAREERSTELSGRCKVDINFTSGEQGVFHSRARFFLGLSWRPEVLYLLEHPPNGCETLSGLSSILLEGRGAQC